MVNIRGFKLRVTNKVGDSLKNDKNACNQDKANIITKKDSDTSQKHSSVVDFTNHNLVNKNSSLFTRLSIIFCRKYSSKQKSNIKPVSFLELFRFASCRDRWMSSVGILFAIIVGAIQPMSMFINGRIADILISYNPNQLEQDSHLLMDGLKFVLISGIIGLGLIVLSFAQYFFLRLACIEITNTLRIKFIESVLRQDASFFDKNKFGALNAQLNSSIERVSDGFGDKIGVLLRGISSFFIATAIAFIINWRIALSMCAVGPICAIIMSSMSKIINYSTQRSLCATESAGAVLQETLLNVRTVQACNGEHTMIRKFEQRLIDGRYYSVMQYVWNGLFDGFFFFVLYIFNAIGAFYGAQRALLGDATGGDVLIVTNLIVLGAYYLGAMSPYITSIFKARIAAAAIYNQINKIPERIDPYSLTGLSLNSAALYAIEFSNVTFDYLLEDGRCHKVLRGLSWKAEPGQSIALVGHSGCGKSTCISLITRFYEVNSGSITISGIDVRNLNVQALRSKIGVVSQEPALFTDSVIENITLGDKSISREKVEAVCRLANAHEFIEKLENGYDTQIGSGHVLLSGGQKQRLAIARALVHDPPILLLDEATSALDAESEILVQNALEGATRGRTTIVIAHRLSTLRNVDKIIVIEQGRVVESGTHQTLSKSGGIYSTFVQSQSFSDVSIENITKNDKDSNDFNKGSSDSDDETNSRNSTSVDHSFYKDNLLVNIKAISESIQRISESDSKERVNILMENNEKKRGVKRKNYNKRELEKGTKRLWNAGIVRIYRTAKKNNYGKFTAAIIFSALRGLELVVYIKMMGEIFDSFAKLNETKDEKLFKAQQYEIAIYNIAIGFFCLITLFLGHSFCGWTAEKVVDELKISALSNVLSQNGAFFDKPGCSSAALIRRITTDAYPLKASMDYRFFNFINNSVGIIALLIVAFICAWQIAAVGCLVLALLSILPTFLNLRAQHRVIKSNSRDDIAKLVVEIIENVRTIQLLTRERYFCEKYKQKLLSLRQDAIVTARFDALIFACVQSFLFLSDAFCFGAGILLIYYKLNDPYDVYIASMNQGVASFAVLFISTSMSDILKAGQPAKSIFELIEAKSKASEGLLTKITNGNVSLEKIDFAYPTRPRHKIADNLSLSVKSGECIALVGPSGGGKSTIISLLQRFYEPNAGNIKIDNLDLSLYALKALRKHVAIVSQEPVLFSGSIYDNIRLGVEHCTTIEDVMHACELANAKTFIESFPLNYMTEVGEKSSKLSGGQKQRIAIARALVRNPKILLLDEATSALDATCEQLVQQALSKAQRGRASIVIAHRLSSIQHADRIYFIRSGHVVESGTYANLIANPHSEFAKLVSKQQLQ